MKKFLIAIFCSLVAVSANAQSNPTQKFKEWTVGVISENAGMYAITFNDSNVLFGNYCYFKIQKCVWILGINLKTEEDARYPVLMNSKHGALNTAMTCDSAKNIGVQSRCVFETPESISESINAGGQIGFAFPLADGKFHVSRFSLSGANDAVNFMRDLVSRAGAGKENTRDSRL